MGTHQRIWWVLRISTYISLSQLFRELNQPGQPR